jgi:hypothetical protein
MEKVSQSTGQKISHLWYRVHLAEQKVMPQEFTNTKVEQHHGKIFLMRNHSP